MGRIFVCRNGLELHIRKFHITSKIEVTIRNEQ